MTATTPFVPSKNLSTRKPSARTGGLRLAGDRSETAVSAEVEAYIRNAYTPTNSYPAGVLEWARDLTIRSNPSGSRDARTVCRRICDMGEHLVGIGWTLTEPIEQLLSDGNITGYLRERPPGRTGTAATTASQIRRVRKAVTGERRVTISGGRVDVDSAVTPASDDDVRAFTRWVRGIDTSSVHHRDGLVLAALVRGAGCTKPDLNNIDINSLIIEANEDVSVAIGGAVARTVRVSAEWAVPLVELASSGTVSGSLFEIDGRARRGTSALKGLENRYYKQRATLDERSQRSLPRFLNVNAFRAAWLLDRLQDGTRLDRVLHEAGLVSAAALDRYLQFLPDSVAPRSR